MTPCTIKDIKVKIIPFYPQSGAAAEPKVQTAVSKRFGEKFQHLAAGFSQPGVGRETKTRIKHVEKNPSILEPSKLRLKLIQIAKLLP